MDERASRKSLSDDDLDKFTECAHQRLEAGDILRYHTAPQVGAGQTVGQHTWRGLVLLDMIWPAAPIGVWRYFLYHDVPELFTGDIPSPVKWSDKEVQKIISRMEDEISDKMGLPSKEDLPLDEQVLIEMIDVLELMFYCQPKRATLKKAEEIYNAGYEKVWKLSVQLELILRKSQPNFTHQQRSESLSVIRKIIDP